ncbi:tetratricopeptide repeat protein [Ketobacter alkanivorans]|uniref:tetratricopeptide repeat protein n=1 Tax=Ketobacter alkanivorans TaxID=1917421 RepID=UPI0013157F02|nr:tetratricopeptide repeat protein [Ketobacter alkanivorans]
MSKSIRQTKASWVISTLTACSLLCALVLTGCAPSSQTTSAGKGRDLTLADLKRRDVSVKPQELEPIAAEKVLASYEQAVALFSTQEERALALRRMADLTMVATEDNMIASLEESPLVDGATAGTSPQIEALQYTKAVAIYEALILGAPAGTDLSEEYYLLAKAYDLNGESDKARETLDALVSKYPDGEFTYEAQFRRGEHLFLLGEYSDAAEAYAYVLKAGPAREFYEHSLYKHGWSLYKLGDYDLAVGDFVALLDGYMPTPPPKTEAERAAERRDRTITKIEAIPLPEVSKTQQKTLDDTLRVLSMSFSNLEGAESVSQYFRTNGSRIYEFKVYSALAELYLYQERYKDAADAYAMFSQKNPLHPMAPSMSSNVIDTYQKGGFPSLVLPYKEKFVEQYGVYSAFWARATPQARDQYSAELKQHLIELAQHYHSSAQKTKQPKDYGIAARWYREFLTTFPNDENAPVMNMLLGETLFAAKDFRPAIEEFERTAYDYPPHADAEKAAYFALLAHQEYLNTLAKDDPTRRGWIAKRASSALRFAKAYPANVNTPKVLDNVIEDQLLLGDIESAIVTAQLIIELVPPAPQALREKAWITYANGMFDKGAWVKAEEAISKVLEFNSIKPQQRVKFEENLATCIYKQGEILEQEGRLAEAAGEYLRVAVAVPNASVRANADYDAANILLQLEEYDKAINVLEGFRKRFPSNALTASIPAKLSFAYEKTGNLAMASAELLTIAMLNKDTNPQLAREALLQAAEMREQTGDTDGAIELYKKFIWDYERPVAPRMEAQYKLVGLYEKQGDSNKRYFWLNKLVETHASAGPEQSDRTLYLAAYGSYNSADALFADFKSIRLTQPLKTSLKKKKSAMQKASKAYTKTVQYGVIDFTTAANYKLGEVYRLFARSIMESERPRGLDELALEEYEILLEDQALPFEDKAIAIFQTNSERTSNGVWDEWIQRSYESLSKLSPGRYNKTELTEDYVDVIY